MGFSVPQIIFGVYLRESIPGITRVTLITFVSFIGITAIAGAIGAGGLGDFAIRYGYQMGYRDMILAHGHHYFGCNHDRTVFRTVDYSKNFPLIFIFNFLETKNE